MRVCRLLSIVRCDNRMFFRQTLVLTGREVPSILGARVSSVDQGLSHIQFEIKVMVCSGDIQKRFEQPTRFCDAPLPHCVIILSKVTILHVHETNGNIVTQKKTVWQV